MEQTATKKVTINISEKVTIVDLSRLTQSLHSEIYLIKNVNGSTHEINLKSFLGLITMQLKNGDHVTIKAVGEDCDAAVAEVEKIIS